MKATLNRGHGGLYYTLDGEDGQSIMFQTDWDYPGLAQNLGWSLEDDNPRKNDCEHDGTDGTVKCRECGLPPGHFIGAAQEFLDEHDGEEFDLDTLDDYFAGDVFQSA